MRTGFIETPFSLNLVFSLCAMILYRRYNLNFNITNLSGTLQQQERL
jgi:hypothetical protein